MATSENGRPIIWYNTTCDSWGACNENALVVVYADDLTEKEHAAYLDAEYDEEVRRIVVKAAKRIAEKVAA